MSQISLTTIMVLCGFFFTKGAKTTFGFNSGYIHAGFTQEVEFFPSLETAVASSETVYAVSIGANTRNLSTILQLSSLKFLYLDETFVRGSFYLSEKQIQTFFQILNKLDNLEYISCFDAGLLSYLENKTKVKGLELKKINAGDFNFLLPFSNLLVLIIKDNSIRTIPSVLGEFVMLQQLELYCNSLTSMPTETGQLSSLIVLQIMAGPIEKLGFEFVNLQRLNYFKLWGSTRLKNFPAEIYSAANLTELYLEIREANLISEGLSKLKNLRILFLMECQKIKALPDELSALTQLQILYLSDADKLNQAEVLKKMKNKLTIFAVRCNYLLLCNTIKENQHITLIIHDSRLLPKQKETLKNILPPERLLFEYYLFH